MMHEVWRNPFVNTPFCILLVGLIDEFILRQNPHWALVYSIYSLLYIPIGALWVWRQETVIFGILKCCSIAIPVLILVLFRLAHVSVNTCTTSQKSGKNYDAETLPTVVVSSLLPTRACDDENIRHFEMKRVYYHCLLPKQLINCLAKCLLTPKATYGFNIFVYVF